MIHAPAATVREKKEDAIMTVKVGIVGFGFMGTQHFNSYGKIPAAEVVAIADIDRDILQGKLRGGGNLGDAGSARFDVTKYRMYPDAAGLFNDPGVDIVDLCVPTDQHAKLAVAAMASGKNVIIEKPLAWKMSDADKILAAAKKAKGKTMCAMCIRFWPEWVWLKEQLAQKTFGKVYSVTLRRYSSTPRWSPWYLNHNLSGDAIFDLHIHDTDFMMFLFGKPRAVMSVGTIGKVSKGINQVVTQYLYPKNKVQLAAAEGGWNADPTFGFTMRYTAVCEKATLDYDCGRQPTLQVHRAEGKTESPKIIPSDGWTEELRYFVTCVAENKPVTVSTIAQAYQSVKLVHAELKSVKKGGPVKV